ncbi:MAG: hypothetical protein JW969_18000 [Spirochaetales bacterium]|nr:hypothetical protein [Spirochaetales bacterium]
MLSGNIVAGNSNVSSVSKIRIISMDANGDCDDLDQSQTVSRSSETVNTVDATFSATDTSAQASATTVLPGDITVSEDNL